MNEAPKVLIVGAGLVGALMAHFLKQLGIPFHVFEKRPDPRNGIVDSGRSINLALSHRGLHALEKVGLKEQVLKQALPMKGRFVHEEHGKAFLQPYDLSGNQIYSVSRSGLNELLISTLPPESVSFDTQLVAVDGSEAVFEKHLAKSGVRFKAIIGADGANSSVRNFIKQNEYQNDVLSHRYQELHISAQCDSWAMRHDALHIWPRHQHMFIALPNTDKSFTGTLFLQGEGGEHAFEQLSSVADYRRFFDLFYGSAVKLIADFDEQVKVNPVSSLSTGYNSRWCDGNKLLIGDAAHAIVPFYGQGMNAGFEDCRLLAELLSKNTQDVQTTFQTFFVSRKKDADAIAQMALENFEEMRDAVVDPTYLKKRQMEKIILNYPNLNWRPRYSMVTFSDLPYSLIAEIDQKQKSVMDDLFNLPDVNAMISSGKLTVDALRVLELATT